MLVAIIISQFAVVWHVDVQPWWERISLAGFSSAVYRITDSVVQFQPHVDVEGEMGSPPTFPKYDQGINEDGSLRSTKYAFNLRADISDRVSFASQQEHEYSVRLDWAFTSLVINENACTT